MSASLCVIAGASTKEMRKRKTQRQCTIMPKNDAANVTSESAGADIARRHALLGIISLPLVGAQLGLSGCAAPPPEADPFDPSSLVYPPPPEQPRFYYDRTIWGSNDVVKETSSDRLRRFATGESIRGQGFAKPFGVAAFGGRVFVSDTVSRRVHAYDFPRKRYYIVGNKGVGRVAKPLGLAVGATGTLYVVDNSANRINLYDLEGSYRTAAIGEPHLDNPTDVAVSPNANRFYVLDTGRVNNDSHGFAIFDGSGNFLKRVGRRGSGEGEFNLPLAIATDKDGNVYVVDTGNFRVQIFNGDGEFLRSFGEAGRYPGQFGHPKSIAVDEEGKIYISDTSFALFQIFDNSGRILMSVGERDEAGGPGRFLLPAGIAVDVDQRIYMADQFFRKLEVFRPAAVPMDWPLGQRLSEKV